METDLPTGADYANSNAQHALQIALGQADASKAAGERLKALETKVKVLATVVDHLASGKPLETLRFDDEGNAVSSDEWEEITFSQIKTGDELQYIVQYEGKVEKIYGVVKEFDSSDTSWSIGAGNWVYSESYHDDDEKVTYLRKRTPFEWPNKLGAVVKYEEDGVTSMIICVEVDPDAEDANPTYFHPESGTLNKYDLEYATNLQTLYEGTTLE